MLISKVAGLLPSRARFQADDMPILRGTAIGSILGILPGGGAILASFASYTVEKRLSRTRRNSARARSTASPARNRPTMPARRPRSFRMLTLGIPANPVMALMIGAMIIQGIVPGPNVAAEQPALFWGIIASMWIGNLMLVLLNLPLIGLWVSC